ncbi:MAG: ATP-binding protein [Xanthobacteraceae bacterium]|nr:ATP-binding protein [Xanthobacteraceae bacterium]
MGARMRKANLDGLELPRAKRSGLKDNPEGVGMRPTAAAGEYRVVQEVSDHRRLLFPNGIAHDLRNVLQTVASGISIAESRMRQGRVDEVQEILARIGEAVDRAGALVNRTLRNPAESRKTVADIEQVLTRLGPSLHWALGAADELVIAIGPDLPSVYCVASEFENAILNLVTNARDAMPNGGRVTIAVDRGSPVSAGKGVVVRVHDTGLGMDAGVAARAFEPYFTTKSDGAGTGLGLAMVAAFAKSIGGSAAIEHTSASGTTVALMLPGVSLS